MDARLEDGSRVNVILPPIALEGPIVTRKFSKRGITIDDMISWGQLKRLPIFKKWQLWQASNIFVSGGQDP